LVAIALSHERKLRADGDDAIIASLAWRLMHNNEYQRMTAAESRKAAAGKTTRKMQWNTPSF
jgi:hypothetical protein